MSTGASRNTSDEVASYLAQVKQKLDSVTSSDRQFELTTSEVIELTYISQRIEYYLKMFAGKREPRSVK